MTIGMVFQFGNEFIEVKVENANCFFRTTAFDGVFVPIEGLKLSKSGTIKEFPDLKGNEDWKKEAIKRFKEKLKSYKTEIEQAEYIIEDLKKFGYVPKYIQRSGHRQKELK